MRTIKLSYANKGAWEPMYDGLGKTLHGVLGKSGVRGQRCDGSFIGADFIHIKPGCGFDPHAHEGDHILHVIEGRGILYFDANVIELYPGNVVFVPAEVPHAVSCPIEATTALTLLAIGHPHHTVNSSRRSYGVSESHGPLGKTPPAPRPAEMHSRS